MDRVNIETEGDLILVVQDKVELRVSSFMLKRASPVLKALLGPHFAEGQTQGSAADPKTVSLPDDDARGMTMLCYHLHLEMAKLKDVPTCAAIETLAVVADKYDCIQMVTHTIQAWLGTIDIMSAGDPGAILHATYLIDYAEQFYDFTQELVNRSGGLKMWKSTAHETSQQIEAALRRCDTEIRRTIDTGMASAMYILIKCTGPAYDHYMFNMPGVGPGDVDDEGTEFETLANGTTPEKCTYFRDYASKHIPLLAAAGIGPPTTESPQRGKAPRTLTNIMHAIQSFDINAATRHDDDIEPCNTYGGDCCDENIVDGHVESQYRRAILKLQKDTEFVDLGLCLDCFRHGGPKPTACRVYHWKE